MAEVAEIPLTGKYAAGRAALVDAAERERVARWTWWCDQRGYASTHMRQDGRRRLVRLGRFLLGLDTPALQADHINRNPLDNRLSNLRAVSSRINRQNTGGQSGCSSVYRGIYYDRRKGRWRARVMLDGTKRSLGGYATEIEAAHAVEAFRAANMPWVAPDNALSR